RGRRLEGAGRAHGAGADRGRAAAAAGRRGRRRRRGPLPPRPLPDASARRPGGGAVIGSLRGTLLDRGADEITIEVGGVGYRVTVSPTTAVSLGDVGTEVFCWVHHHQREDAVTLYGFATKDERGCFEALLGAHGVGPALALAILSIHTP